ncbi:hypothetical protein [uncultured Bacteroides sp.]|uniref:hypothetical protein n=1 Tax=uncultured Bacteroides sp. TaxID=162156 RepID=UPI0025DD8E4B|nr:hypothetical protein [uncultured Bacteroides sp.]
MKNILFILSLVIGCGCSNEIPFDTNRAEDMVATRVANLDEYSFEIYGGALSAYYQYDCKGNLEKVMPAMVSFHRGDNNSIEPIIPQVLTKPVWIDSIAHKATMYNGMFAVYVYMQNNISSKERSGDIVWQQPESNKILSIKIVQEAGNNHIMIAVRESYKNHPVFTATTTYPVKKDISCRIPYEAYNDGGKYDSNASITIPKGETKGTYEMDYNGSPLVDYHGDIKGYKLYEGTTTGDDIYTYSFVRYW